jgi:chromate reductase
MHIVEGGLDDPRVIKLIHTHVSVARALKPDSSHALDLSYLRAPHVTFWSAWEHQDDAEILVGVGALKELDSGHGEVKSMHIAEAWRGRGRGGALLRHIISIARARGMSRLSLDTGTWPYFAPARALKDAIAAVDAVLFVTPEYNRSIPGALKNAIDWASRPWGTNSFHRKPSAMIGTSPGKIGTAVGQQHLKSILSFCNSPQMNAIEAYIEFTPGLVTDDGEVTVASTAEFLANYMKEFHAYISRVYMALPRGG